MVDREKLFNVRMSEPELEMLREVAEGMGLSQSDAVRQLVRQAHRDLGADSPRGRTAPKRSPTPTPKKR